MPNDFDDMGMMTDNLAILAVFMTPAFFWAGLALIGIPIIIHILNRRRFKTVVWAAMEYLLQAMKKNRRRLKFEQWLLLALRCLLLALFGLALARPNLSCQDSSLASAVGQVSGLHVFVIDNSYSMAYEAEHPGAKTHFERAKNLAKEAIDKLRGGESVVVITTSSPAQSVIARPSYDLEAARSAIDRIEQGQGSTDLAGALRQALDISREESKQPKRNLYLFTDGTRSAFLTGQNEVLQQTAKELDEMYALIHIHVGKDNQSNQAALALRPTGNLVTTKFAHDFRAVLKGYGDARDTLVQWKLDDRPLGGGTAVRIDENTPDQIQSQARFDIGGPHVLSVSVLSDDRLAIDNTRFATVEVASELKVLIVEGQRGLGALDGSGAFLELALAPPADLDGQNQGRRTNSYIAPELISDLELGNKVLPEYRAVILCGVGQLSATTADQLQKFAEQGGTVMVFMGEPVDRENYNSVLLPRGLMPGSLTKRMNTAADAKGYTFDFRPANVHRYLEAFKGEEKSGLGTAQIFTYWQMELSPDTKVERVIDYVAAEGAKPDPAITVHAKGKGQVVFVSTTANAEWTNLPAKLNYVALIQELMGASVSAGDEWMNLIVGDRIQIPSTVRVTMQPVLKDAAGVEAALPSHVTPEGTQTYRSDPISKPGVYLLNTGEATMPISVNLPPEEADVRTLDPRAIAGALGDVDLVSERDALPAAILKPDDANDMGWILMLIVLALAALECYLAMRFGHHRKPVLKPSAQAQPA